MLTYYSSPNESIGHKQGLHPASITGMLITCSRVFIEVGAFNCVILQIGRQVSPKRPQPCLSGNKLAFLLVSGRELKGLVCVLCSILSLVSHGPQVLLLVNPETELIITASCGSPYIKKGIEWWWEPTLFSGGVHFLVK